MRGIIYEDVNGKTILENLPMLYLDCNRQKGKHYPFIP